MQIAGFLFGLIAWIAFIILNRVQGGFLGILALLVFALAFLARGRLHRETGWNMRPLTSAWPSAGGWACFMDGLRRYYRRPFSKR